MGSFGEGVVSLLDTYTRCLTLLKDLTRGSKTTDEQERLGGSIRSSRSRVRKYYSSKVSENGTSFERGDTTARSSLRRLVRRLRAFVDSIMKTFGKNSQVGIDYESLMSLSQASGVEAIRTMTDLSERVSVRSFKSHGSVENPSRPNKKSGKNSRSSSTSSKASQTSKNRSRLSKAPATSLETTPGRNPKSQRHSKDAKCTSSRSRRSPRGSADSLGRRQSMLTTSSDSTKLGEIRHREDLRQAQATYPLWTYPREPVKLKKGKLFGLFAR